MVLGLALSQLGTRRFGMGLGPQLHLELGDEPSKTGGWLHLEGSSTSSEPLPQLWGRLGPRLGAGLWPRLLGA